MFREPGIGVHFIVLGPDRTVVGMEKILYKFANDTLQYTGELQTDLYVSYTKTQYVIATLERVIYF